MFDVCHEKQCPRAVIPMCINAVAMGYTPSCSGYMFDMRRRFFDCTLSPSPIQRPHPRRPRAAPVDRNHYRSPCSRPAAGYMKVNLKITIGPNKVYTRLIRSQDVRVGVF